MNERMIARLIYDENYSRALELLLDEIVDLKKEVLEQRKKIAEQSKEILDFKQKVEIEQNHSLNEMSLPQSKVKNKIRDLSCVIFEHLIKILLYGKTDSNNYHHWVHEVNNWFNQCVKNKMKMQGKDRYPNENELFKWLIDYYSEIDDIDGTRYAIEHDFVFNGYVERINVDNDLLYAHIIDFLQEIIPVVLNRENSDDKVEEILMKYLF